MRTVKDDGRVDCTPGPSGRLHSAPKGLLRYYILHRIAEKPVHGYEVIQDIDSKTEGAWRPGAGSLYPILKKLESEGLIKTEPKVEGEATRRIYHITQRGSETLAESKSMFANFQQRWGFLRKLLMELIPPDEVATHFVNSSNHQFQLARELLERRAAKPPDMEYMLREYALALERQLAWAKAMISETSPKLIAPVPRQKGNRRQ